MSSLPPVAALILNWNDYEDTRKCIKSLKDIRYQELDIYVVDNGSTDESVKKFKSEFDDLVVIQNGENLGYGGGMNAGLEQINTENYSYVWLLNSDVIVPEGEDVLPTLVEFMEEDSSIGVATPLIKRYPDTEDLWFWRGEVGEHGKSKHLPATEYDGDRTVDNDYIPLAAALCRTRIFETIGLLPEDYFLYFEDVEFSLKLNEEGYKLLTNGSTEVYHKVSQSSGGALGPTTTYYMARNQWLFERRCRGGIGVSFLVMLVKSVIFLAALHTKKGNLKSMLALLRGHIGGLVGLKGRGPYP